jgi:tetratricopeptide (TPR) repeat protein
MEITYEEICQKYKRSFKNDISPALKYIIEEIYNGLYNLDNIILNDEVDNGDIYLWIGNYCKDIVKNCEKVKKYYLMAIENGNSYAMNNLGIYYKNIEKNYEEMKKYYLMAIENGDSNAMHNLGFYYYNVEKNYEEMKKYYLMAIENGDSDAMCNLGYYYHYIEKNCEEMKKYYLMAIKNGDSYAMNNLCSYYKEVREPIENLYIDLVNVSNKNEIIDNKINELLNKYEHLKDIYISPILK